MLLHALYLRLCTAPLNRLPCYGALEVILTLLRCALSLAAQCIVIGRVYNGRAAIVALWVCYHDNSKLRASIFTKLG